MRESIKIAVVPASGEAGASFAAGLTAMRLAEISSLKVTLAELGHPYFYQALGMEKRFIVRSFIPYRELLKNGKSVRELDNSEEGINWALLRPGKDDAPPAPELFRFIYNVPGELVVLDCSGLDRETMVNVLAEAEKKIIVVDPLPSRLMENYAFLGDLRLKFPDAVYIVNKMNKGVHRAEFSRFLGTKNYISIPAVDQEYIYRAEYACILPGSIKEVRSAVAEGLAKLEKALV